MLVFQRWRRRRHPSSLIWTIGLLCYAVSTGTQAYGMVAGWSPLLYRWWYFTGAFLTAAYLGMGTLYLLAPRGVAHAVLSVLVFGTLLVLPLVFLVKLDLSQLPPPGVSPSGQAYPFEIRITTPLFNIFGAVALCGGALHGAWELWRRGLTARASANLLIAAGALVPSFTSGLTRFGFTAGLALGQLVGLSLLFAGFLLALRAPGHVGPPVARPEQRPLEARANRSL
jgi:hypothetical protein